MRAGYYAERDGVQYRCSAPRGEAVRLYLDGAAPRPEGFRRDGGQWTRLADRRELDRLTVVRTVAVWRGHRVTVTDVPEPGLDAVVEQWSWPAPELPGVHAVENGLWQARVPVAELTEVVEDVRDVP